MDVKDRQNVQKNIIRLPTPRSMKRIQIRLEISMRDLRTLGTSCCAAGVDDDGGVVVVVE